MKTRIKHKTSEEYLLGARHRTNLNFVNSEPLWSITNDLVSQGGR